jgi:hypothetical protein
MMDFIVIKSTGHLLNGKNFHLDDPSVNKKYYIGYLSGHYLEVMSFDGTYIRLLNSNVSLTAKII